MALLAISYPLLAPCETAVATCLCPSHVFENSREFAVCSRGDDHTNLSREIPYLPPDYENAYIQPGSWWTLITVALPICILIKLFRFSTRASVDQTKSLRPLRSPPRCNRPILSLQVAPTTVGVPRNDCIRSPNERGRNSPAVLAADKASSPYGVHIGVCITQSSSSSGQCEGRPDKDEVKSATSSPRNRSALVQAPPITRVRCLSASTTTYDTTHIRGLPPSTTSPTRLRYQSLRNSSGGERRVLHLTRHIPLEATLFGRFGSFSLLPAPKWFVLFIGVNNDHVKDPEHDLALLEQMLCQSSRSPATIHFESLSGSEATSDKIKATFKLLYLRAGRAPDGSKLLVFLSGQGDEKDQMRLLNEEFISERDFHSWTSDIHAQWNTPSIMSLILLDVCREGEDLGQPDAGTNQIHMVRSCSPGQLAHVLAFRPIPWSCFLLAFFLASCDLYGPNPPVSTDFEAAFKCRMRQLGELVLRVHDRIHEGDKRCKQCINQVQKCDPPKEQTPEGESTGWDTLGNFGQAVVVACPGSVQEIVTLLDRKMTVFGVVETSSNVSHLSSGSRYEIASQPITLIERGATQPVCCV